MTSKVFISELNCIGSKVDINIDIDSICDFFSLLDEDTIRKIEETQLENENYEALDSIKKSGIDMVIENK